MVSFEKEIHGKAREGVHLAISKNVARLISDLDFEGVSIYFVVDGTRSEIKNALDVSALGIGHETKFSVILESQKKTKEELQELAEEIETALQNNFGFAA